MIVDSTRNRDQEIAPTTCKGWYAVAVGEEIGDLTIPDCLGFDDRRWISIAVAIRFFNRSLIGRLILQDSVKKKPSFQENRGFDRNERDSILDLIIADRKRVLSVWSAIGGLEAGGQCEVTPLVTKPRRQPQAGVPTRAGTTIVAPTKSDAIPLSIAVGCT